MLEQMPTGMTGISGILLVTVLGISMFTDLKTRRIPNSLVYPFAAAVAGLNLLQALLIWSGWTDCQVYLGGIGLQQSLLGATVVFSGMFFLFLLGCGAGDVKLMTVVGGLIGFRTAAEVWMISLFIAAAFVALMIVTRVVRKPAVLATESETNGGIPRRIPLAPFFFAGTTCVAIYPLLHNGEQLCSHLYSLI